MAGAWLALLVALAVAELLSPFRQSQQDGGRRLVTNFSFGGLNLATAALVPFSAVLAAQWSASTGFGLLHRLGAGGVTLVTLTILIRSLGGWTLHWLAHRVPLLWRAHRTHHSDTVIDLSTGLRHHPAELLYVAACHAALAAALGFSVEALAVYEGAAIAFSLWTHANLSLPERADRSLRLIIATPAAHGVHHSASQPQTDSNYGEIFTCWDRLFGTYSAMPPAEVRHIRPGLGDAEDELADQLLKQLLAPLRSVSSDKSDKGAALVRKG